MAREVVRCPRCGHINPAWRNTCEREGCPTSLMGVPSYPEEAPPDAEEAPSGEASSGPRPSSGSGEKAQGVGPTVVRASRVGETVGIEAEGQLVLVHLSTGARLRVTGDSLLGREGTVGLEFFVSFRTVSRRHAHLRRTGPGRWTVTDAKSTHGTYVNGERLSPGVPKELRSGDILKLADQSFVVNLT